MAEFNLSEWCEVNKLDQTIHDKLQEECLDTMDSLTMLTEEDMKEMGFRLGHRKQVKKAIERITTSPDVPQPTPVQQLADRSPKNLSESSIVLLSLFRKNQTLKATS